MGRGKKKRNKHRQRQSGSYDESRTDQVKAFFKAARDGYKAGIRQFLATGGDINERTRSGQTVLMQYRLTPEMNRFLISLKADVNAQDNSGMSVLACQCIAPCFGFIPPDFDKVRVLLEAGASPALRDNRGRDLEAQVYSMVCSGLEAGEAKHLMEFIRANAEPVSNRRS